MMENKDLLKGLLKFKLQTIDCLLELLPGKTHITAKQVQNCFISLIHEVTAEYLEKEKVVKKDRELKKVVIE